MCFSNISCSLQMLIQCDNGHLACDGCCNLNRKKCPSCSLPIGFVRSRAIEKILESAKTSCKNMHLGCTEKVSCLNSQDHEKICKYVQCKCPCCGYCALSECLYEHFTAEHNLFKPISSTQPFCLMCSLTLNILLLERTKKVYCLSLADFSMNLLDI